MAAIVALLCTVVAVLPLADCFGEPQKFLIVTAPVAHKIGYYRLPSGTTASASLLASQKEPFHVLVEKGLSVPQGIAVDDYRKKLYVADPDLGKLIGYDLISDGYTLSVANQFTVATNVEPRWVTIDGVGNVFFTDEATNRVIKVPAASVEAGLTDAEVLYHDPSVDAVSKPGGIVTDNYFVYWLNKASGKEVGSLLRGSSAHLSASTHTVMAKNSVKAYGVCLGPREVFYTDELMAMYAVPRSGGAPMTVTSKLAAPRGCAFDGESTIFVADKDMNAVYQFPANAKFYNADAPLTKVADFQGAFGVAVHSAPIL